MAAITPSWIQNFETNMVYIMSNAWTRTLKKLWWTRLATLVPSSTSFEYRSWFLESARIVGLGPKGASMKYDSMVSITHGFGHQHFGNGLELFRDDIEDDEFADKATKWSQDVGGAQQYWPQRLITELIKGGEGVTFNFGDGDVEIRAYDELPFFSQAHPVNPYDVGGATLANGKLYSNLHPGTPFTAENLARVVAYVEGIRHPGDAPMNAMPTIAMFPTPKRMRATQMFSTEWYTDTLNGGQAAAQNVVKTTFEFEPPIFAPEFNYAPNDWYLAVPADDDAIDASLMYVEREAFSVNTYGPKDQASLADMQVFRWHNRGRNGGAFGHPYRLHKCKAAGVQPTYLSDISI